MENPYSLPQTISGMTVHFVGIKGTGMCALAELFHRSGARVTGSDRSEQFYTDAILQELGIPYVETFSAENLPIDTDLVIYSAAYSPETNEELKAALSRSVPILKYTDALGAYSVRFDSSGIAGVHGKTTTTALTGTLLQGLALPAQILAGSAVGNFGGRSTLVLGNEFFVAETCEYRRHFLSFHPQRIVLTSVESDHQDYYPSYESIRDAFVEYVLLLPKGGELIYCADDRGACEVADLVHKERNDIVFIPYGFTADGIYRILSIQNEAERTLFSIQGLPVTFKLPVPGKHTVLNAVAALALTLSIRKHYLGTELLDESTLEVLNKALESFKGSKRRSEIIGEAKGILIMDDYGHHPTAIKTTLEGLRAFYPQRRLVVSFMSHTYTRTAALLDEFADSLKAADVVILHKIYGSAREHYSGGVTGRTLYEKTRTFRDQVYYFDEIMDALPFLKQELRRGDLFVTLGAGDNWKLGKALYEELQHEEHDRLCL
ncbi:UDP-N-acetylmuramate--L-alanine ligase [Gracilinema caldarium]|uniref:UDP-N-acetylmuramate--L-alanine ligase n=1 Tax=Gracilinema caldarium (strain ATCC 51460 / DSM 7334 / H1) TaxID=744872 RepID=F8F0L5_GRAC1|nr:UDP-N-acetylmuramate--L-alanine ligase [Gracilinema caldarium]AEJ19722.1 UDP-N-acetylmuramate--L-alanine ligase [Gracilinema caldarium DSM 7334]